MSRADPRTGWASSVDGGVGEVAVTSLLDREVSFMGVSEAPRRIYDGVGSWMRCDRRRHVPTAAHIGRRPHGDPGGPGAGVTTGPVPCALEAKNWVAATVMPPSPNSITTTQNQRVRVTALATTGAGRMKVAVAMAITRSCI